MTDRTKKENLFISEGKALVGMVSCDSDALKGSIDQAVSAIGGFQRLLQPGDTILVKPNFNTADPPPASSDPAFVKAVIALLYRHGAGKIVLGESSMFRLSTRDTLRHTGMLQAAEEAGAETVFLDEGGWVEVKTGGRYLRRVALAKAGLEAHKIVYIPCLKTHRHADFTLSLKLAMGFVRPRDRIGMHVWRLREKLADLNLTIAPDLIVMDARRCFISGGPATGELREPGLVLASGDRVAIDVEGLKVIQSYAGHSLDKSPWEYITIRQAVGLGLGAASDAAYQVVTDVPTILI